MVSIKSTKRTVFVFPKPPKDNQLLAAALESGLDGTNNLYRNYYAETEKVMKEIAAYRGIEEVGNWHFELALSLAKEIYEKQKRGAKYLLSGSEQSDLYLAWEDLRRNKVRPKDIAIRLLKDKKWRSIFLKDTSKRDAEEKARDNIRKHYEDAKKLLVKIGLIKG